MANRCSLGRDEWGYERALCGVGSILDLECMDVNILAEILYCVVLLDVTSGGN